MHTHIYTETCTKPSEQPPIGSKWIQGCTNTSSNVLFKAFGKALSPGDNSPPVKGWMLPLCFSTALPSLCFFSSFHIPRHRSLLPLLLSTDQVVYFKKKQKTRKSLSKQRLHCVKFPPEDVWHECGACKLGFICGSEGVFLITFTLAFKLWSFLERTHNSDQILRGACYLFFFHKTDNCEFFMLLFCVFHTFHNISTWKKVKAALINICFIQLNRAVQRLSARSFGFTAHLLFGPLYAACPAPSGTQTKSETSWST